MESSNKYYFMAIVIFLLAFSSYHFSKEEALNQPVTPSVIEVQEPIFNEVIEIQEEVNEENILSGRINLGIWQPEDVLDAMVVNSPELEGLVSYEYVYRDDGTYYSQYGPIFGKDPFSEITYDRRNREYELAHFRLFNLGFGDIAKGTQLFEDYRSKILKKSQIDPELTCFESSTCSNIQVIRCEKQETEMYAWFEGNYLFTAYDDGFTLDAFKKFYCQETNQITGDIVKNKIFLEDLADFIRNLS